MALIKINLQALYLIGIELRTLSTSQDLIALAFVSFFLVAGARRKLERSSLGEFVVRPLEDIMFWFGCEEVFLLGPLEDLKYG